MINSIVFIEEKLKGALCKMLSLLKNAYFLIASHSWVILVD